MSNIYDNDEFFSAYEKMPRSKGGLESAGEWHQLKPMFPDLKGKTVLDLGCGYGWHSKYASLMGAEKVIGIDISRRMIEKAKTINCEKNIEYEVCNLEDYSYPEDTYDLVISNLVLHYIENLEDIYRKVYRTLKTKGVFLFNIEHPTFTAGIKEDWIYDKEGKPEYWAIDNYYSPGERETLFLGQKVIKEHHTLTQILNTLLIVGFRILNVEEAMPPKEMMDIPGMKDEMRRPMMLLVKAIKEI